MAMTATIGGTTVSIQDTSPNLEDRIEERTRFSLTVIDLAGTTTFSKGQPVEITDDILGNVFNGYVNQPKATLLYPNPGRRWAIDCVDETWLADKRTSQKSYKNQYAGTIAVDQVQRYGSADGLTCKASLRWDELLTEWQQGTLTGTVATTNATDGNPGDGDLELALAGSKVTVSGTGSGFVLGNGLLLTGYASSGYTNAYTNRQVWSGSQAIASTSDQFIYDVWVSSSSPAIKAGCDFICSDGTVFSTTAATDLQFLGPSLATDLSGLANDTWYTRYFPTIPAALVGKTIVSVLVGFNSASQGTYTAYFRRIHYISGGVTTTFFGDSSTLTTNIQANNLGYTNVSLKQVSVEDKTLIFTHGGLSIGAAGIVQSSQMTWATNFPNGSTGVRETSIDGGSTWQVATSGSAVPNLLAGMVATSRTVQYRDTLTVGSDPTTNCGFGAPTLIVNPAYASTKSDLIQSYTTATDFNTGTLTNLKTVGSGTTPAITLNGIQRNWDTGDFSNQPQFGTGSPSFQQVVNKQMELQTGTGADIRSQLLFAGTWQNFTAEVDVQVPSSSSASAGLVYRTTGWQNNNDTYAYAANVSTNSLLLGRGTNSSSGAGSFTTITNVGISLTANSVHRLKIVINGNTHQVYLDGVLLINATDSTWTAAGYIGLRTFNNTGSTVSTFYDNFGVCAALSGTWQSPSINIASSGTYGNSLIQWDIDGLPDSTTGITAQTSIDGGTTFQSVTNGGAISGLTAGQSLTGKTLILKLTLTASNAPVVPVLNGITAWVLGQYSSSGTRSTAPVGWDSMQRANVGSGFGAATNGQTYTQSGTGTTNLTSNEAQIVNTTGDVQMRLGSTIQQDTDESVRFSLSAGTMTAGMELHFIDSSHYYRLVASTTALSLVRNVGGGNTTVATSTVALTTGTFYRMRFRAVASGLTALTFYGRVWADGTAEPTTWNVTATDSPYRATVLVDAPLHYYRLNDTNTTAVDIGSSAQNGTLNGTITESQPGLLPGDPAASMLFDGNTGSISLPNTGTWPTGNGAWTLECWCKPTSSTDPVFPGNGHLITIGNPGTTASAAAICQTQTGGWGVVTWGGTGHDFQSNGASIGGTVYYIVATYDGAGTIHLYIGSGGTLTTYGPFSCGTLTLTAANQTIGNAWNGVTHTNNFAGNIEEAAIYNTALSLTQITNHYNAGVATGGFALMANGTGTAQFDSYRVTTYPDPGLSLAAVGRAATSLVNWNANLPASVSLAVATSIDNGATYQPLANAGDYIPTISTAAHYAAVRANSPLAFYRLNEKSGKVAYDSGNNGNTATLNGSLVLGQAGPLQGLNEIADASMQFDGATSYVLAPSGVSINGATAFSIAFWALPVSDPVNFGRCVANENVNNTKVGTQIGIRTSVGGVFFAIGNGTTTFEADTTTTLSTTQWTHVVGTWDGSNLRIYINGALGNTTATTGSLGNATHQFNIGRNPDNNSYYTGKLSNVALYNTALSLAQIQSIYNAGINATQATEDDTFTANTSASYTQSNFGGGVTGTWTWDTANSRLVGSGGTNGTIVHNPALSAADGQVMADFDQCDGSGLVANYVDANDLYFVQIWDGSGTGTQNAVKLFKRFGGVNTQLGSTATISWTRGNYKRFILDVQAGIITVSLDGAQLIQVTDGSPLGAGKAGLLLNTLVRCYSLRIQQYGQNVSALSLYTKLTLTTTDPTVTPQVLDLQAFVSSTDIGIGKLIASANYNRTYVSANLADLNQQCGTTWTYVRPDKSVVFQDRTATPAPWILDSANQTLFAGQQQGDVLIQNLELDTSGDLYRNRQILTGVIGSASYTEKKTGDGSTRTWNVANNLTAPPTSWTLNGQPVTFGIQGVDTGKQFYYQIGSKSLTQDSSQAILASTDTLLISYPGAFTTEVVRDNATPGTFANTVSQAEMAAIDKTTGIVENVLDVSNLNMTVSAAQAYGDQLLQRYGLPGGRTLTFMTLRSGLAPGQQLTGFVLQQLCVDVQFLVTAVGITAQNAAVPGGVLYWYKIEACESATLGSPWRMLTSLLNG